MVNVDRKFWSVSQNESPFLVAAALLLFESMGWWQLAPEHLFSKGSEAINREVS